MLIDFFKVGLLRHFLRPVLLCGRPIPRRLNLTPSRSRMSTVSTSLRRRAENIWVTCPYFHRVFSPKVRADPNLAESSLEVARDIVGPASCCIVVRMSS